MPNDFIESVRQGTGYWRAWGCGTDHEPFAASQPQREIVP